MKRARSSDAEREATVSRLRDAAGEGRLTLEELADRVVAADGARTRGDLARLVVDLPAPASPAAASTRPTGPLARRVYGILGGGTLSGRVRFAPECRVLNIMGGADLDLSQAVLTEGRVTLHVFSFMGGSTIFVPPGVDVEYHGRGLLGWDDVEQAADGHLPAPGAPAVRTRSVSIMGGTDVKRRPSGPWRWPWQRRRGGRSDAARQSVE